MLIHCSKPYLHPSNTGITAAVVKNLLRMNTYFLRPQLSRPFIFSQVNNSPPRRLRQQGRHTIDRFLLFTLRRVRVGNPWTDRTRFPELDEEPVKFQPMPIHGFPNNLSDTCTGTERIVLVGDVDRDSLKVFGRDGLECRSSPLDVKARAPEIRIFEPRRCREVDRGG